MKSLHTRFYNIYIYTHVCAFFYYYYFNVLYDHGKQFPSFTIKKKKKKSHLPHDEPDFFYLNVGEFVNSLNAPKEESLNDKRKFNRINDKRKFNRKVI